MIGEPIRLIWPGGEHDFCFDIGHLRALEQRCDAGVGVLMLKLLRGEFKIDEVMNSLRLALQCGSHMTDDEAIKTIERAFPKANLFELSALAGKILTLFVAWPTNQGDDEPGESKAATSPNPNLSETEKPVGRDTSAPLQ